jgi:hypothetical protein
MPLKRVGLTLFVVMTIASVYAQDLTSVQSGEGTLPVMFDSVRALVRGDQVMIGWSNLTERDVSFYMIERSRDGKDFKPVARINPSSNLNEKAAYSITDADPMEGNNYYRISVAIMNGRVVKSRILKAQTGFSNPGFTIYPNPVMDEKVNISLAAIKKGKYVVQLTNTAGIHILQTTLNLQSDGITQQVNLPDLKAGVYIISVKGEAYSASKMLVKK